MSNVTLSISLSSLTWDKHVPRCKILLNDDVRFDELLVSPTVVNIDIDDDVDAEHQVKIMLSDKQTDDTILDVDGTIVKDTLVKVDNVTLDGITINNIMFINSKYVHNSNGAAAESENKYTGVMGCNGYSEVSFTTPIFLWLLENT